jgi:hypothetical protein
LKTQAIRIAIGLFVAVVLLGGAALGVIAWRIHESVQEYCGIAQQAHPHPGDDVAALTAFMNSNARSFRERNLAVWTLGRIGDSKALPSLEAVYTGEVCEHDRKLCQYELEKAIKLCGGVPNPPRTTRH